MEQSVKNIETLGHFEYKFDIMAILLFLDALMVFWYVSPILTFQKYILKYL